MGRTLDELGQVMTAEEFGLHMALEVLRTAKPAAPVDPEMQAMFGGD